MIKQIKIIPVESTAICAAGYDIETADMRVVFTSGKAYTYRRVPKQVFEDLLRAKSKGRYMNENIIGIYDEV